MSSVTINGVVRPLAYDPYWDGEDFVLPLADGKSIRYVNAYPTSISFGELESGAGSMESVTLVGNNKIWEASQ